MSDRERLTDVFARVQTFAARKGGMTDPAEQRRLLRALARERRRQAPPPGMAYQAVESEPPECDEATYGTTYLQYDFDGLDRPHVCVTEASGAFRSRPLAYYNEAPIRADATSGACATTNMATGTAVTAGPLLLPTDAVWTCLVTGAASVERPADLRLAAPCESAWVDAAARATTSGGGIHGHNINAAGRHKHTISEAGGHNHGGTNEGGGHSHPIPGGGSHKHRIAGAASGAHTHTMLNAGGPGHGINQGGGGHKHDNPEGGLTGPGGKHTHTSDTVGPHKHTINSAAGASHTHAMLAGGSHTHGDGNTGRHDGHAHGLSTDGGHTHGGTDFEENHNHPLGESGNHTHTADPPGGMVVQKVCAGLSGNVTARLEYRSSSSVTATVGCRSASLSLLCWRTGSAA